MRAEESYQPIIIVKHVVKQPIPFLRENSQESLNRRASIKEFAIQVLA
jgi:hypothetical protein